MRSTPARPSTTKPWRWTATLAAGAGLHTVDAQGLESELLNEGIPATVNDYRNALPRASVAIHYALSPSWGLRLGYSHIEGEDTQVIAPSSRYDELREALPKVYPVTASGAFMQADWRVFRNRSEFGIGLGLFAPQKTTVRGQSGQPDIRFRAKDVAPMESLWWRYRLSWRWWAGVRLDLHHLNGTSISPMSELHFAF